MDLSGTIIPKSDQLNADDLVSGPRTITITRVSGNEGSAEQPVNVYFEGDNGRPWRPCKTTRRILVAAWGADASVYPGRSLTIYRDPAVQFGGLAVGGIRISHMSHIERDLVMAMTVTKAKRAPVTIRRLVMEEARPGPDLGEFRERARLAAEQGSVTFREWWSRDDVRPHREALKPLLPDLKRLAEKADARGAPTEPDPFGTAPPDDDARARALAEAEAEVRARDGGEYA